MTHDANQTRLGFFSQKESVDKKRTARDTGRVLDGFFGWGSFPTTKGGPTNQSHVLNTNKDIEIQSDKTRNFQIPVFQPNQVSSPQTSKSWYLLFVIVCRRIELQDCRIFHAYNMCWCMLQIILAIWPALSMKDEEDSPSTCFTIVHHGVSK